MNDGTTPLSKVELTAMNTRWSRFCINPSRDNATGCAHDVPDLLADVDRLSAELERLRRENLNLREMIEAGGDRARRLQLKLTSCVLHSNPQSRPDSRTTASGM